MPWPIRLPKISVQWLLCWREVDTIVLTGGLANSVMLVGWIREMVGFIAKIIVYPGEDEISALIAGGLRALKSREAILPYPPNVSIEQQGQRNK